MPGSVDMGRRCSFPKGNGGGMELEERVVVIVEKKAVKEGKIVVRIYCMR